jgi:hypothetical protein
MFGPNNPAQPAAIGRLPQHQLAAGKREIPALAGFSTVGWPAQTMHRPLQAVAVRRVVSPGQGLDRAAQQTCLQVGAERGKAAPVDGGHAILVELQHLDRRASERALARRAFGTRVWRLRG